MPRWSTLRTQTQGCRGTRSRRCRVTSLGTRRRAKQSKAKQSCRGRRWCSDAACRRAACDAQRCNMQACDVQRCDMQACGMQRVAMQLAGVRHAVVAAVPRAVCVGSARAWPRPHRGLASGAPSCWRWTRSSADGPVHSCSLHPVAPRLRARAERLRASGAAHARVSCYTCSHCFP